MTKVVTVARTTNPPSYKVSSYKGENNLSSIQPPVNTTEKQEEPSQMWFHEDGES